MIKLCVVCNASFDANALNAKTCSSNCFALHRKAYCKRLNKKLAVDRNCKYCGVIYTRRYERSGFCSRSCGSKFHLQNGSFEVWRLKVLPRSGKEFPCAICSTPKYVAPRHIVNGNATISVFCSRKCASKHISVLFTGEGNPFFGKTMSDAAKAKQHKTLFLNHNVDNAFELAQHKTSSAPQLSILEKLCNEFTEISFKKEAHIKTCDGKFIVDIIAEELNFVVEFYGTYWHCDSRCYSHDFVHPHKQMTAEEIWKHDLRRVSALRDVGLNVFIVHEYDYKINQEKELQHLFNVVRSLNEAKENNFSIV